ncbi:subtilisin-like protein [Trametes meyenii]|nr:subtilisin-like protein [Trametes meyenii]
MVAASLLILSLFPLLSLGRPNSPSVTLVTRGQHSVVPEGFFPRAPFLPGGMFRFIIALKSGNASGLIHALLDVSDPANPKYGQHLSKDEVDQMVSPRPESIQAVSNWLNNNNVISEVYSSSGDVLHIQMPLAQANTLLDANFRPYVHEKTNTTMWRTLSYALPADISPHVAFVYPTTQFIPPATHKAKVQVIERVPAIKRAASKRSNIPPQCGQVIVPPCLQAIYNIPSTPATAAGNSLGVSAFGGEIANPDDLKTFLSQVRPDIQAGNGTTFAVQTVDGGSDGGQGTTEASLDIDYTVGLATNVPTTFFAVGESQNGDIGSFLDLANTLIKQDNPPLVLTTSFGFDESDFSGEAAVVAQTLCNAYAQLGARGTSVLFASGDGGVSGAQADDSCNGRPFLPTFPASCPYVTAIGSTFGLPPETAANFSSGGFSNIFARPAYQDGAVSGYLTKLGDTNAGLFNASGRAYPDVATQGVNFIIEQDGQFGAVDGTSASSLTFASIVALLNDRLLATGRKPLGFLNPLLYSKGVAALNDVTKGSNPGCGTHGFPAVEGWDAVTGLGTPDFQKLLAVVSGGNGGDQSDQGPQNATSSAGQAQIV